MQSLLKQGSDIVDFTVGICANGEARNLLALLEGIRSEWTPDSMRLARIVLVASDCDPDVLLCIKQRAQNDSRIFVLEESQRHGKADAVNKIIRNSLGSYVVFINSDAMPRRGSIQRLVSAMESNQRAGVISACPYFEVRDSPLSQVEALMWNIHNQSSLLLNHMQISNHSSDEMMVVRRVSLEELPSGLVNDGAYLAGCAKARGYLVNFCEDARVRIDVPSSFLGLIQQRRRIIYGHFQIRKLIGEAPRTVEALMFSSPGLALSIVLRALRKSPRLALFLPLAILSEGISTMLAAADALRKQNKHGVWRRYGRN
ncbi:MAG TPA: glycosyltransferase family 2 protein [Nitrososphaerales archaeon]|nr:glycosyltransferase family 2 protein [Nitrososphaerales archaeon]